MRGLLFGDKDIELTNMFSTFVYFLHVLEWVYLELVIHKFLDDSVFPVMSMQMGIF